MAPSEWTRSVRAVRDTPVADYSAPCINTTRRIAYRPTIALSPFLLALFVTYFTQTLWCCGQLWLYVGMGSFGTRLHRDCNAHPAVERHHCIIRNTHYIVPLFWSHSLFPPFCGSTQLRESSRPGSIITSHPHPMLLEPGWLLITASRDREEWLNFLFLGDGRGDGRNNHEKLGLNRISCASQFTIPETAGTCPDLACNNTDTRSSQPNQASRTPDFSYPLVSSTLFSSSSPISLFLIHITTIIAEYKVKSSRSISPWHDPELTPSTAYTQYSIHRVQHPPKIVCLPFIHMIRSWPLNVASASGVPPYTIDRHQPALYETWKVQSPCHIPTVAS